MKSLRPKKYSAAQMALIRRLLAICPPCRPFIAYSDVDANTEEGAA